jgi:HEAT repeat protein
MAALSALLPLNLGAQATSGAAAWLARVRSPDRMEAIRASSAFAPLREDPAAADILLDALRDPSPRIRKTAAAVLGELRLAPERAIGRLKELLADPDELVRVHAAAALGKYGGEAAPALLDVVLRKTNAFAETPSSSKKLIYADCGKPLFIPAFLAAVALGEAGSDAISPMLQSLSSSEAQNSKPSDDSRTEPDLGPPQVYLRFAVSRMAEPAEKVLLDEVEQASGSRRSTALKFLESWLWRNSTAEPERVSRVLNLGEIDRAATYALGQSGPKGLRELRNKSASAPAQLRERLVEGLGRALDKDPSVERDLARTLANGNTPHLRQLAANGLCSRWKEEATMIALYNATKSTDTSLRQEAFACLILAKTLPQHATASVRPDVLARVRRLEGAAESGPLNGRTSEDYASLLDLLLKLGPNAATVAELRRVLGSGKKIAKFETIYFGLLPWAKMAPDLAPLIAKRLDAPDSWTRHQAAELLASMDKAGWSFLDEGVRSGTSAAREVSLYTFARAGDINHLRTALVSFDDPQTTHIVVEGLRARRHPKAGGRNDGVRREDGARVDEPRPDPVFEEMRPEIARLAPVLSQRLSGGTEGARSTAALICLFGRAAEGVGAALAASLANPPIVRNTANSWTAPVEPDLIRAATCIGPTILLQLTDQLRSGRASSALLEAISAFGTSAASAADAVEPYLRNKDQDVQRAALLTMAAIEPDSNRTTAALVGALSSPNLDARRMATSRLWKSSVPTLREKARIALLALLVHDDAETRRWAMSELSAGGTSLQGIEDVINSEAVDDYLTRWIREALQELYYSGFRMCMSGRGTSLPEFPWPPPQFSERMVLPRQLLGDDQSSLGQADAKLSAALDASGYGNGGLFSIPGGFVRVTKLERLQEDRSPVPEPYRWSEQKIPPRSLLDYLGQLFLEKPGIFRFIVFAFTDRFDPPVDRELTFDAARSYFLGGGLTLPADLAAEKLRGKNCYVLIYEFGKEYGKTWAIAPSPQVAKIHLERAGIWRNLGGPE